MVENRYTWPSLHHSVFCSHPSVLPPLSTSFSIPLPPPHSSARSTSLLVPAFPLHTSASRPVYCASYHLPPLKSSDSSAVRPRQLHRSGSTGPFISPPPHAQRALIARFAWPPLSKRFMPSPSASPLLRLYGSFILRFSNIIISLSRIPPPLIILFICLCVLALYVLSRRENGGDIDEEMRMLEGMVEEVRYIYIYVKVYLFMFAGARL